MKRTYEEEANNLRRAIDIAIEAFKKYPPNGYDENNINQIINFYLMWRNSTINAEPKYRNLRSLQYVIEDAFTYFQESSGKTVDFFWDEIAKNNLPYKRENKVKKILKRGKINNDIEYQFVTDIIVAYRQVGLIDDNDV